MDKKLLNEVKVARTLEGRKKLRHEIETDACLWDEKRVKTGKNHEGSPYWDWVERRLNQNGSFSQELATANPDVLGHDEARESALMEDCLDRVFSRIKSLSQQELVILNMLVYEGRSLREIAGLLNTSKKAVEKTVERFRKKLGEK